MTQLLKVTYILVDDKGEVTINTVVGSCPSVGRIGRCIEGLCNRACIHFGGSDGRFVQCNHASQVGARNETAAT